MFSWQTLALGVTSGDAGFVPIGIGHKGAKVTKHCTSIAFHLADGAWFNRSGKPFISKGKQDFSLYGRFLLLALSDPYSTRTVDAVAISFPARAGIGEIHFRVFSNPADSFC